MNSFIYFAWLQLQFPTQFGVPTILRKIAMGSIVGKRENVGYQYFILFWHFFYYFHKKNSSIWAISICYLLCHLAKGDESWDVIFF